MKGPEQGVDFPESNARRLKEQIERLFARHMVFFPEHGFAI